MEKKTLSQDLRANKTCEVQKGNKAPPEKYLKTI